MPDIGATLRAARERQQLDVADVEAATKIRAKYLRALEEEEWDQLPGPTYVKSFLRTYAEALGLDARLLVEEYKVRHERLSDQELRPISPPRAGRPGGRGSRRGGGGAGGGAGLGGGGGSSHLGRDVLVALIVVAVVAALIFIGRNMSEDDSPSAVTPRTTTTTTTASSTSPAARRRARARAARARAARARARVTSLRVIPTGTVYVCLRAEGQGAVIDGQTLSAGQTVPTRRSRRFVLGLGNSQVRLRINGKTVSVPSTASRIAYEIRPGQGRRQLPDSRFPTCTP